MATNALPPFSFKANKYDQSILSGRIQHFYEVTSPFTLFTSSETLKNSVSILNKFKTNTLLEEKKYMDIKKTIHSVLIKCYGMQEVLKKVYCIQIQMNLYSCLFVFPFLHRHNLLLYHLL